MAGCLGEEKANTFADGLSECPQTPNLDEENW